MGFKQTATHRYGKGSYHQIGLVRGQFGNVPLDKWLKFLQEAGFDGWEEASWELDLRNAATPTPAPRPTPRNASTWPRSTAWRSSPSPRTCRARPWAMSRAPRRCNSSAARRSAAYKAWRDKGNKPPRTDPLLRAGRGRQADPAASAQGPARLRPPGPLPRQTAESQGGAARLRRLAGPLLEPFLPVPALARQASPATPSPTSARSAWNCWSNASARSGTLCKKYGVTFDLECHPSERAMGDIESASDYINYMCKAGYEGVVGFNLDGSHMEWQGVSVDAVHPRVRRVHPLRPHQGRAGEPRAHAGRAAGRPSADGPSAQRLELRHGRARPATPTAWKRSSSS